MNESTKIFNLWLSELFLIFGAFLILLPSSIIDDRLWSFVAGGFLIFLSVTSRLVSARQIK